MPGRWSATPQPLTFGHFDNERVPQSLRFDLSPDEQGETLAVAIKRDGDTNAYGFNSYSYANGALCLPHYALPDETYDVEVRAHAGPVEAQGSFVLHNAGQDHRGLQIRPRMLRPSRERRRDPWPVGRLMRLALLAGPGLSVSSRFDWRTHWRDTVPKGRG